MSQVTVFAAEQSALSYLDKKGNYHGITAEGALFKGGEALKALKNAASDSAFHKAENGRYRAAYDILSAGFPATAKAADALIGSAWANKAGFTTFVGAVLRVTPKPGKDFTAKQLLARALAVELDTMLNPVIEQESADNPAADRSELVQS